MASVVISYMLIKGQINGTHIWMFRQRHQLYLPLHHCDIVNLHDLDCNDLVLVGRAVDDRCRSVPYWLAKDVVVWVGRVHWPVVLDCTDSGKHLLSERAHGRRRRRFGRLPVCVGQSESLERLPQQ